MALEQQKIVLLGLPGAGKTRIQQHLTHDLQCQKLSEVELQNSNLKTAGCYENVGLSVTVDFANDHQIWCVIDIRSELPQQVWLQTALQSMVNMADGVVFNFSEAASIDQQSWWGSWLKKNAESAKPVVRCLNGSLPKDFIGFDKNTTKEIYQQSRQQLNQFVDMQSYEFSVETIVLDHLLMGLDNSRQNLAMKITRVQAVLDTMEYENLVEVQGSAYRWDCYAAENPETVGQIIISGFDLQQTWLQQLVDASRV